MCGIGGIFNFKEKNSIDKKILRDMTNIMTHRGPDGSGFYTDRYVGLGHRRLSIIDLSENGKQPMTNENKSIWLVYNGEIYNFKQLRKFLESKGHRFISNTDSETIIHAYEEFGEDCVKYLRGMFAFCIWDIKKKQMFLARDRVGKKPLFYYLDKNKFIFASELKAILTDKSIKKEILKESVSHYFSFGYIPAPLSIFKNIKKILPGHTLLINKKGEETIKQYWDIKFNKIENNSLNYFKNRVLKELEQAVKIRMISDVPLGAFLSGGIDSSAIVGLMSKHSQKPIKTFSIGFEESFVDETKHARIIAERFNTDHKELIVKPNAIKILPKLIWQYNEPYCDSSSLPSYYLAEMTKKHVTVALNGDGGDENFAGYDRYAVNNIMAHYKKIPSIFRKTLFNLVSSLPLTANKQILIRKSRRFLQVSQMSKKDAYMSFLSIFDKNQKNEFISEQMPFSDTIKKEFNKVNHLNFTNQVLYVDIKRYLPDDLLVKMDIATMAHSLETRSPFLDNKLMDFVSTIPANLKLNGVIKKFILKQAIHPLLPKKIINRKKMGFSIPEGEWFKKDLKSIAQDILLSKRLEKRGILNPYKIKKLLDQHNAGKFNHGYRIWNLLWFELWNRIYMDSEDIQNPPKDLYSLV